MPAHTRSRRCAAAVVGAVERHGGPADPRLPELRRNLRAAELEEHVARIVADWPPLTPEQIARVVTLLSAPADDRATGG